MAVVLVGCADSATASQSPALSVAAATAAQTSAAPTALRSASATQEPSATPAPTPTASPAPTPAPRSLSDLVAAVVAQMKAGRVTATSAGAVSAAIAKTFSDPAIAAWQPRALPSDPAFKVALDNAFAECRGAVRSTGDAPFTQCNYAGLEIYKTYQTWQTPASLAAVQAFLGYIATRSDMRAHYPSDNSKSMAREFLDILATCEIGMGQVNWCGQDWSATN